MGTDRVRLAHGVLACMMVMLTVGCAGIVEAADLPNDRRSTGISGTYASIVMACHCAPADRWRVLAVGKGPEAKLLYSGYWHEADIDRLPAEVVAEIEEVLRLGALPMQQRKQGSYLCGCPR